MFLGSGALGFAPFADTIAYLETGDFRRRSAIAPTARESDIVAPTLAGPEIGVASINAFACQLAVLAALSLAFGRQRNSIDAKAEAGRVAELMTIPYMIGRHSNPRAVSRDWHGRLATSAMCSILAAEHPTRWPRRRAEA
jgi:glucosamine 6-phosphate synthetase-like amidotransferase/phosphosugar isomerase protein